MSSDTFADLEDRLRADLPRLADSLLSTDVEVAGDESLGPVPIPLETRSSSRRRWVVSAAAVAAVVLVLVGIVVAMRAADHDDARPVDVGPDPTEESWSYMASSPLSPREAAVSVWTGSEVIIWGGRNGLEAKSDGAAYNPSTDTWRMITPNSWGHPDAHGVWTGSEMVVLAKNGGAAYDPVTDSWRELPLNEDTNGGFLAPVWTGSELLGIGWQTQANDASFLGASALDADNSIWMPAGAIDISGSVSTANPDFQVVWTGSEAVVWDGAQQGWAYDPTSQTWQALAKIDGLISVGVDRSAVAVIDGSLSVVVGLSGMNGFRLHLVTLTDTGWHWAEPDIEGRLDDAASATSAGDDIVVFSAGMPPRSVDPASGVWTNIDPDQVSAGGWNPSVVWTGRDVVAWGGTDTVGRVIAAGSVWHPAD